ncbi:MAG: hypothetical protein AAFS10_13725 [Myxococcota bacterium]
MKHPIFTHHGGRLMGAVAAAVLFTMMTLAGCSSGRQVQLNPQPLPSGIDFTGEWYSPQYEKMFFEQKGNIVTGTFTYKEGGTIEGEADGNTLTFTWVQKGNKTTAISGSQGRGYFVLSPTGNALDGEWGYGEDMVGGGLWTAERIQKDRGEAFDPDAPIFDN